MEKSAKVRLDMLLVSRGLFPSRETARRAIMAGMVSRHGQVLDKPGTMVSNTEPLCVARPAHNFVSRGGLKLAQALDVFDYAMDGKVVLDIGASTGGFTDCALQRGAQRVFAVDVGYGQLAWKLRNDERVTVMERTNFRHVPAELFQPKPDVVVMDVSFISIRKLFPKIVEVMGGNGTLITLVKPQFEAGREKVGKGGIVRDPTVHYNVLCSAIVDAAEHGLYARGLTYSPISGGDGNIEFLAWFEIGKNDEDLATWYSTARSVVVEAWRDLRSQDVHTQIGD